jgi:dienelactone hydrolase
MHFVCANGRRRGKWHARLAGGVAAVALALSVGGARADSTAASVPDGHGSAWRGAVVSVVPVTSFSATELAAYLDNIDLPSSWSALVRYGVDGYRVVYRTVSVDGSPTTASGLVVLPRRGARSLRVVEFGHGTVVARSDAPSFYTESDGRLAGLAAASAGFAAVAPDYLGLGAGPGPHPFLHAASEATASVDLLRASLTIAARHGRRLDPQVFVTGFSQGGQAAMALGRVLQQGADPRFSLGALAPVSGTYDVAGAELPAIFSGQITPLSATYYLPYLLLAWNRIYHLYRQPSQAFRAPYDQTMPIPYDGYHTSDQVTAGDAPTLSALLTPEFLGLLQHPAGALLRGLRINDATCDWQPHVPVRLYAASGDRDSVIANAWHCQAALRAHGADVPVIDVGPVDHNNSLALALPKLLAWFQQLS